MEEYNTKISNKKEIIYLKKFENQEKYDLKSIKENAPFFTNLVKNGFYLILAEKNPDIKLNLDQFKNMENNPFPTDLVKNGLYLILAEKNPDIKVYFDQFKNMEKYIETKGEDELKSLINYLISINNLNYTKEFQQRLIYFFHYKIKEEKISTLMGKPLDLNEFKELNANLSDNTVLYIFEESKPNKYEKVSLISNKYEKEAFSVEIFESIKKIEKKNILSRFICKSIFSERELIIEKLNINYEASLEEIEKELQEEIQFLLKSNYSYKDLLFQIENKLFRCPESYDIFTKEIMKAILLLINNNKKNAKDKQEISKNKINFEEEKKEGQALDKSMNEDIKEAFKQIIEKEKKIKELESKISRYPIELEEGEKLMSIIIKSDDNKINVPIICKNSFKFMKIEEEIYEMFDEYSGKENIFTLKGIKINRNKTLEENGIKDKDIVCIKSND